MKYQSYKVAIPGVNGYIILGPSLEKFDNAVEWCRAHKSDGHYSTVRGIYWWFENEEDALLFTLKWVS